jgi:hypothetical protein
MKKKMCLIITVLLIGCFAYFRWFSFYHSIIGNNIHFNLPDFVDKRYLEKEGFNFNYEHYFEWYKKDLFNVEIKNKIIGDSLLVGLATTSKEYPFVNHILLSDIDPQFDMQLIDLINENPDSVKEVDVALNYSHEDGISSEITEYYSIESSLNMSRTVVKYHDVFRDGVLIRPKQPNGILITFHNPKKINWFYHFISRLPFFLTFDPFVY